MPAARARAAAQAIQRVEEARWIVERAKSDVAAQRIQHSEDLRWMVEVMRLAEEKARSEAAADQVRHASELRWKLEQLQRLGLAQGELLPLPIDDRNGRPTQSHIDRTVQRSCGVYSPCRLNCVRRDNHRHVGNRPHQGDVFYRLVRGAVLAHCQAGVGCAYLHIQL